MLHFKTILKWVPSKVYFICSMYEIDFLLNAIYISGQFCYCSNSVPTDVYIVSYADKE